MKRKIIYLAVALCGIGSMSADQTVQSVQQSLKNQGCYYGKVTGEKSAETTAAIRRYQIRKGLQVTGQLNPETLRSLNINSNLAAPPQSARAVAQQNTNTLRRDDNSRLAQNSLSASPAEQNQQLETNPAFSTGPQPGASRMNRRMILAEVQQQLISRGYYQGRADGRHGRCTAFALRTFQFASGLPPTGHVDPSTLNALGISAADQAYFEPTTHRNQIWVPVTKFKHGKWEMKWKKYHGHDGDGYGDWARKANGDEQGHATDD